MKTQWTIPALLMGAAVSSTALADTGFYLGATAGNNSVDTDFRDINLNFDENDTGWSAFAGLQLTQMLAVEGSYNNFGKFSTSQNFDLTRTDVDAELTGYEIFGVLSVPVGPVDFYGKAGVVFWDAEASARIQPPVGSPILINGDSDGNDLAFGAGLRFFLTDEIALRGEVEWFDIEDTEQVSFVSAGLSWRF